MYWGLYDEEPDTYTSAVLLSWKCSEWEGSTCVIKEFCKLLSFQVIGKLHVAETTINSLNQQLVELSRSESLTRAKEQHESVVNAMKRRHEEEVLTLKQKLDEAVLSRDHKVPLLTIF